jgi:ADP-heptose:LPS heptosyltransferase
MYIDPSIDYQAVREKGFIPGGGLTRLVIALAAPILRIFRRKRRGLPSGCRRIVLIRLGGIGDVVLATTIAPALKLASPGSRIDLVCCRGAERAFESNGVIDGTFSSPVLDASDFGEIFSALSVRELLRIRRHLAGADLVVHLNKIASLPAFLLYGLIVLLSRSAFHAGRDTGGRGSYLDLPVPDRGYLVRHEVDAMREMAAAMGFGAQSSAVGPVLSAPPLPAGHPVTVFSAGLAGYAAIHPGSSGKGWRIFKRIAPEPWVGVLAHLLEQTGMGVVFVGGPEDREFAAEIIRAAGAGRELAGRVLDMTGRTALPELLAVIEGASLYFGTDSGVAHIAGCTGTPGIVVFTFSDHIGYRPLNPKLAVVRKALPCSPCIYWRGYEKCEAKECRLIDAADMLAAAGMTPRGDA